MLKTQISQNDSETRKLGQIFAKEILKNGAQAPRVLGLVGDLGGGKTAFLQGFAKGLGIKEKILSPTFVIVKKFKIKNKNFDDFYHIDCYRVEGAREILNLNFRTITKDPRNIVAVEWADIIKKIMPKNTLWIKFIFITDKKRRIILQKCTKAVRKK